MAHCMKSESFQEEKNVSCMPPAMDMDMMMDIDRGMEMP